MASGAVARVQSFQARYPWLGPIIWILSSLYFVTQVIVAWVWNPPYSMVNNTISDLGNTACGIYHAGYICSPRSWLMNIAFVFLGVVMASGALLLFWEFHERNGTERVVAATGFTLIGVAGVGAALVGIFPENSNHTMHFVGAGLSIAVANIAIVLLGWSLTLPGHLRRFMLMWGSASLLAAVCFACHRYFGLGAGVMERLAAYPETIWLIIFGIYVSRNGGAPLPHEGCA